MNDRKHLLISLENRHAVNILSGVKQVELRRRTMHVSEGDIVWLYAKKPVGAVVGYAVVGRCTTTTPAAAWRRFGKVSGLFKAEFMAYFSGLTSAFVLGVRAPKTLRYPISLSALRGAAPTFQPPQFYCHLDANSALGELLTCQSKPA